MITLEYGTADVGGARSAEGCACEYISSSSNLEVGYPSTSGHGIRHSTLPLEDTRPHGAVSESDGHENDPHRRVVDLTKWRMREGSLTRLYKG